MLSIDPFIRTRLGGGRLAVRGPGGAVHSDSQLIPVYCMSHFFLNSPHCGGALQVKSRFGKLLIKLHVSEPPDCLFVWVPDSANPLFLQPKFSLGLHCDFYPAHSENWNLKIERRLPISRFLSFKNKIKMFSLCLWRIPWRPLFPPFRTPPFLQAPPHSSWVSPRLSQWRGDC